MRLYDTQRSGNAWKVRLLAGFLGLDIERVTLSIDRDDLKNPAFLARNPLGQVPLLELSDGRTIAESAAILFFLARETRWWPADYLEQTRVLTWLAFEQSRHMHPLARLRLHLGLHPDRSVDGRDVARWRSEAHEALALLDQQLGQSANGCWVATSTHPSIADVALYPYTRLASMGGVDVGQSRHLPTWLARVESLPGYQPLVPCRPDLTFTTVER